MTIPRPWETTEPDREPPGGSPNTAPEQAGQSPGDGDHDGRESDRARARDTPANVTSLHPTRCAAPATQRDHTPAAERGRAALSVWTSEAVTTARGVWHGSVWRARPASLRDREARVRRAEWSGGLPALAVPGRVYGYAIALPVTVALRAAEQTVSRPARLLTLVLAVLIPLLLA